MSGENLSGHVLSDLSQLGAERPSRIVHVKPSRAKVAGSGLELFVAGLDLILILVCDLLLEIVPDALTTPVILIWAAVFVVVNFVIRR